MRKHFEAGKGGEVREVKSLETPGGLFASIIPYS